MNGSSSRSLHFNLHFNLTLLVRELKCGGKNVVKVWTPWLDWPGLGLARLARLAVPLRAVLPRMPSLVMLKAPCCTRYELRRLRRLLVRATTGELHSLYFELRRLLTNATTGA